MDEFLKTWLYPRFWDFFFLSRMFANYAYFEFIESDETRLWDYTKFTFDLEKVLIAYLWL